MTTLQDFLRLNILFFCPNIRISRHSRPNSMAILQWAIALQGILLFSFSQINNAGLWGLWWAAENLENIVYLQKSAFSVVQSLFSQKLLKRLFQTYCDTVTLWNTFLLQWSVASEKVMRCSKSHHLHSSSCRVPGAMYRITSSKALSRCCYCSGQMWVSNIWKHSKHYGAIKKQIWVKHKIFKGFNNVVMG